MSVENVKKFYEALSKDEAIKQKFMELSQKYQGQPMDEEKAMALTEQEVLPLAAQMGYLFAMDDLNTYGKEMKQAGMNRELSDEELQAVVGGGGSGTNICIFIGVPSGDFAGFCFLAGEIDRPGTAAASCVFIGSLWA
jgi:bacteriocin-like protein